MSEPWNVTQTKIFGTVIELGGIMADDNQHAIHETMKLLRSKIGSPGFDRDDLITITKPDGSVLVKATVAEFEKHK